MQGGGGEAGGSRRRARGDGDIFRALQQASPGSGLRGGAQGPQNATAGRLHWRRQARGCLVTRAVDRPAGSARTQGSLRARRTHHGLPQRGHPTDRVQCRLRAPCPHAWVRPRHAPRLNLPVGAPGAPLLSPSSRTFLGPRNSVPEPLGFEGTRGANFSPILVVFLGFAPSEQAVAGCWRGVSPNLPW